MTEERKGPPAEFEEIMRRLVEDGLPDAAKGYAVELPAAYREWIARRAGLAADRQALPLDQLTYGERERLMDANAIVAELAGRAARYLGRAVVRRIKRG